MTRAYEIGDRMRSGALWTYLRGGVGTLVQFGSGIVLARLLDPADFGVFYAVTAYTALLATQVGFGVPAALLQAKTLEEEQWNSAFWLMEGIAVVCVSVVVIGATGMEQLYQDDRYADIMRWMSVTFVVMPYNMINITLLQRGMNFRTVSKVQIMASLLGTALSLVLAFAGCGPFSLVAGGVGGAFSLTFLMALAAPWRPRLSFSAHKLRSLISYGWRLHLNNTLSLTVNRVDNMLIGRLANMAVLGLYLRAFSLSRLPVDNLCVPIYQLVFSGFSRIQGDLRHSLLMYQKVLCAITSAVYPILLLLIFVADGAIVIIYGEKWLPAALPLKIMTIGVFVQTVSITTGSLAAAQNLAGRQTPILLVNLFLTILAVIIGIRWGLVGVATGITAKTLPVQVLVMRMMARSHLKLAWSHLLVAVLPALACTLGALLAALGADRMAVTSGLVATDPLYVLILCAVIIGVYSVSWLSLATFLRGNPVLKANLKLVTSLVRWGSPRRT